MSKETLQYSVSTLLNPKFGNLKEFDVLVQPDVGGRYEPNFLLDQTTAIARPIARNLPVMKPQVVEKNARIDSEKYLGDVARLQRIFNRALGIDVNEVGLIRNYNPVLARAMYEQLETDKEKGFFRRYEMVQVISALRERYRVARNTAVYSIGEDSKLRSQDFPTEAFDSVSERGVVYRKKLGSPDSEREQKELEGFLKVQDKFTDPNTPLHSKMVVISGPGTVKDTIYQDNFVDIYELKEDSAGNRFVKMTRFASSVSYEQYKEKAAQLRLNYFNGAKGAIDAWFLSNPIYIDSRIDLRNASQIFEQVFNGRMSVIEEEVFQKTVEDSKPRVGYYLEAIHAPFFDPEEIALRFNAILKGAEIAWKRLKEFKENITRKVFSFIERTPVFKHIAEEVAWLGRQVIEKVMVGCGLSGGFSIGGSSFRSFFSGITSGIRAVGRFISSPFKSEWHCQNCPVCGEYINCEVKPGEQCPNPKCQAVRECG